MAGDHTGSISRPFPQSVVVVLEAKAKCQAQGFYIEIKTTGESYDPSHTGIYGSEHANHDVAAILALQVNHTIYPTA